MKVAIQGASGFIGSRLTEWLLLSGLAEPRPILRTFASLPRIARFQLDWRIADALDENALAAAFDGCEVVFHAVIGDERTITLSPAKTFAAARRAGVRRVVYLSSGVVYGFDPPADVTDDSPVLSEQPRGYNRSKAVAEERISVLRRETGVEAVILRPTIVYGPRATQFTVELAESLLSQTAYLVDGGGGVCNAVYVDNVVGAMWQAALTADAANESFFVSDDGSPTWADFYGALADGIGVPRGSIASIPADVVVPVRGRLSVEGLTSLAKMPMARPLVERISPVQRGRLKQFAQRFLVRDSAPAEFSEPRSTVSQEMVSLQLCRTRYPIEKARKVLSYEPISFEEGSALTNAWLRANGFSRGAR